MSIRATSLAFAAALAASPAAALEILTNGDFETGDLTGWTVTTAPSSSGDFVVQSYGSPLLPFSNRPFPGNPDGGDFFAVVDQSNPGGYVLSQTFIVPAAAGRLTLSFDNFINDNSGFSPNPPGGGLSPDPSLFPGIQFALLDILGPGASPLAPAPGDVVASLINPFPAPALPDLTNPWQDSAVFDLTGVLTPGSAYQIRFGSVDSAGFFNFGVDNVSLRSSSDVPVPAALPLFGLALGALGLAARRRRGG